MAKKIRAFVATMEFPPDIGGVGVSAKRIFSMLADAGIEVHLFAPSFTDDISYPLQAVQVQEGLKVYRVPNQRVSIPEIIQLIRDIDKEVSFDIFHGFLLQTASICLEVASYGKRPVIASIRGIDAQWMQQERNKTLAVRILRNASWITSVSRDSLIAARALEDIAHRSSFIPNAIDTRGFPQWKLDEHNRGVIGTVCTLREKKDIPLLIQSYAAIHPDRRKRLIIVGDYKGPSSDQVRREVERLIQFYSLGTEVFITGFVERSKVLDYLMGMNIFVLSSKHEGLPNAVLEAAGCGLPIVATMVDGVKDIFGDGRGAILVPSGEKKSMTDALENLIDDPMKARWISYEARERASTLSPEIEMKTWLDLYCCLINK
jgi:L-malate glycosyltransferase